MQKTLTFAGESQIVKFVKVSLAKVSPALYSTLLYIHNMAGVNDDYYYIVIILRTSKIKHIIYYCYFDDIYSCTILSN